MCDTLVIELCDPADPEGLWIPAELMDVTTTPAGWLEGFIRTASRTHDVWVTCIISGAGEVIPQGSLTK